MATQRKAREKQPNPVTVVKEPLRDLLVWQAPARLFKKRDREYYTTVGAIIFLLAVILLFLKEWLLIGVIISLGFVCWVLSTVPPEDTENKITTRGIFAGGKRYDWNVLGRFWFFNKWGNEILNIETYLGFPRRLMLLLGKTSKDQIKTTLEKYLILEKPQQTFIDKASLWLQKKVPLETA